MESSSAARYTGAIEEESDFALNTCVYKKHDSLVAGSGDTYRNCIYKRDPTSLQIRVSKVVIYTKKQRNAYQKYNINI